ncbi:MAG: AraC family transcriptional regulator, partial [Paenibacillus sp.]|nr:AraC family transcriptional regulator [Paenibacillus sp.]
MKLITNKLVPRRLKRPSGPFFRKSFIMVLLLASLPTALLAVITYFVGVAQIEREVDRTHQLRLQHMAETLNGQLEQLEKMVTMWTFNPIFQSPLGDMTVDSLQKEPVLELNLAKTLLIMGNSSPLIKEVRLYLPDNGMYLSALDHSVVVPIKNPEEIEFFRSLLIRDTSSYWTYAQGQLSIVQMVPERAPYGYLLAQVDAGAVNQLMRIDPELQGSAFILKANSDWLDPKVAKDDEHPFDYFLRDEVSRQLDKQEGSFFSMWDGDKYAVTYGTIERTGWMYVSATPISKLTQPIVNTSRILLAIGCLGIAVSISLSWFASRKLTQPIVRLVQLFRSTKSGMQDVVSGDEVDFIERQWQFVNSESKLLHERMEQHIGTLRELFLFQLLNEHLSHLSEIELRSRMEQYGWEVEGKKFALLVFRLVGFSKIRDRFGEGDEQLVTFTAANVIGELAGSQFNQVEVSSGSGHDLSIGLFMILPADQPDEESKQRLYEFSEQAVRGLTAVLHLHVLVGIAKPAALISGLPLAYQEVQRSFRHRNLQEMSQIV